MTHNLFQHRAQHRGIGIVSDCIREQGRASHGQKAKLAGHACVDCHAGAIEDTRAYGRARGGRLELVVLLEERQVVY